MFGQDPNDLQWITAGKFRLPKPLATLNDCFIKLDGFHSEGVFRLAGQQGLMKTMKNNMNATKGILNSGQNMAVLAHELGHNITDRQGLIFNKELM